MQDDLEFGLSQTVIAPIRGVFEKHANVEKCILYASRATGQF